ncbi:TPT-domain-containing protein, partial [Piedraia hortae CBS 480.64]
EEFAPKSLMQQITIDAILVALWYTFSISISVYNKWMFSRSHDKGLDFHFPLFTTSIHMVVQFALASLVLYVMPQFRPRAEEEYSEVGGEATRNSKSLMTKWFYFGRITPCGTATALDIGLGNFSLRFISLTFYTMCKSSVLGFVLINAFLFRLEKPTWRLCAIILVMTAGVVMMVAGETAFNAAGFALVMTASFCSGFRWSLTQLLLLRHSATSNPFSSILFLTPVMFVALLSLALAIEGPSDVFYGLKALASARGGLLTFGLILFPGFLAFMMVSAEFALLQRTSVVTLSVCGIFKEVLTISAAGLIFGDDLSPINVSGLIVTMFAIAAYNYVKYLGMTQ